ncbi:MAG: sugar ABC transporter substrate-binding protein [Chloroflexi bacterium]|nr:sugar ABC transporter substrate-binding protein [Chloroflexota bacterium]
MKNFIVYALFVCLIVACAPSVATNPTSSSAPKSEIVLLVNETPEGLAGYQQLIEAYAKIQPGVQVKLNNIANNAQFLQRLAADFAAKTPPDVFVINYRRFGQFAIKDVLEPLNPYIAQSQVIRTGDYYPVALDAFKFKNKQYCLAQNVASLQVYYNKSLFTAANVPFPKDGWTWNEFLVAARALTKSANGKIVQYGLGVDPVALRLTPFIWAHGGELVDNENNPTKLTLDSPRSREAFQWFVDLQVKEHVVPSKVDQATENAQSRFQHGTLGMFLQSRVVTPELRDTIKDFDWDIARLPRDNNVATVLHSDGYCITSGSKNKTAAWSFVEFAGSAEGQKIMVASGRTVPSLKAVAESPLFLSSNLLPANNRVYLDMAPSIRRVPVMTTWLEIEDIMNKEIQRAFYSDASVNDAIRAMMAQTQEFFRQNQTDAGK